MIDPAINNNKNKAIRHAKNPFVEGMVVPIKKASVKLSRLGKDDNILINDGTGEHLGTHVTTYRKVDASKFIKLFTQNIALTFALTSPGIKAFTLLCWAVQNSAIAKDKVTMDKFTLEDFLEAHRDSEPPVKMSIATLGRGLRELEDSKIVAKAMKPGDFFINPDFVFNGDRIAFTTVIERDDSYKEEQQELPL